MEHRAPFAGGDQRYLREVQYATGEKLDARARLHRQYSTSPIPLARFESALIDWSVVRAALECGCGTGRFWESATAPTTIELTLTDLSEGMVQEAMQRAEATGFRVTGSAQDVQALPFADGEFDVVVANHMLYHVPDPDRAVAEIARVLGDDGVALIATNGYGHMGELNDVLAEVFGSHSEGLYAVFGIDSGEARLRRVFASIVWHAFDNDLVVDDPEAVLAYARSFPPGESATEEQRQALDAAIGQRFVDGSMRIRTRTGAFVCRRPRR
jgi:SAM-dependent methyltransferase